MRRTLFLVVCALSLAASVTAQDKASADKSPSFVYRKTKEADLAVHVHYPADWKASDRRPAMIFFFGGGWTNGKIEQFLPQASYFATRGLVTLRADYRVKSRHGVAPLPCVEE